MHKCIDGAPCNSQTCQFYDDIEDACIIKDIESDYKKQIAALIWWAVYGSQKYNLREGWYDKRLGLVIGSGYKDDKAIMGAWVVEGKNDRWWNSVNLHEGVRHFDNPTSAIMDVYLKEKKDEKQQSQPC